MHSEILREEHKNLWNEFVAKNNGHVLQSYEWGRFKGSGKWEPFVLTLKQAGEIKAGISIISRKVPLFGFKVFYAPRGPVVDFKDKDLVKELMEEIKNESKRRGAIARSEGYRRGSIPLMTLRADIDYGFTEARTTYGCIGVKVWIYKGDVILSKGKEKETESDAFDAEKS